VSQVIQQNRQFILPLLMMVFQHLRPDLPGERSAAVATRIYEAWLAAEDETQLWADVQRTFEDLEI
jgi:hypothetical protein